MIAETDLLHGAASSGPARTIRFIDLFCGAGGTSTGAREACEERGYRTNMVAVNHWPIAIETHSTNHPEAQHFCCSIDNLDPNKVDLGGALDILFASPECTNHSIARGGMPINDQSRCTAWDAVKWVDKKRPKAFVFENVREFRDWGPLDSTGKRPLQSKKGQTFQAWIEALRALGYKVEHRILCAADYGDPTTRRRLIVIGVRGRRPVPWPEATHTKDSLLAGPSGQGGLFGLKPWVPARDIINWNIQGKSIFKRKSPYAIKTLRRTIIGLKEFGLHPFIIPQHQGGRQVHSPQEPLATVTTTSRGVALARPYLIKLRGTNNAAEIEDPSPTISAQGTHIGIAEPVTKPYIIHHRGQSTAADIDAPSPTVTSSGKGHLSVAEPYLIHLAHGNGKESNADKRRTKSIDEPLGSIHAGGKNFAIAESYLVSTAHSDEGSQKSRVQSIDEPHPTVAGNRGEWCVAQPFIIAIDHKSSRAPVWPTSDPVSSITTKQRHALIDSYLIKYYGTANAVPISQPLGAVTTKERFALGQPKLEDEPKLTDQTRVRIVRAISDWCDGAIAAMTDEEGKPIKGRAFLRQPIFELIQDGIQMRMPLDILMRMLNARELASAQGFPRNYQFAGNVTETVKQIGNAVPKNMAKAITTAILKVL